MIRTLDARIATLIMGKNLQAYIDSPEGARYPVETNMSVLPPYSSDINAAWTIVAKFGGWYTAESSPTMHRWSFPYEDVDGEPHWATAEASTAAEAICLAALKAAQER